MQPGFLVASLPTFGACYLRNKSTRLACNVIEERLSRVQRLHHGQQLRLGEERPGKVEIANQALAWRAPTSHADAVFAKPVCTRSSVNNSDFVLDALIFTGEARSHNKVFMYGGEILTTGTSE